ncbi:MAG: hypothetical protein K2V38_01380, partial [Gemmataceae bacterium]|nr:hypothetical protein [Gemmataceae bacterium]
RIISDDTQQAVEMARGQLAEPPAGTEHAALLFDGRINLDDGKCDAIIIEMVVFGPTRAELCMAVPYRNSQSAEGFAVHRPKFMDFDGPEPDIDAVAEAFFRGVDSHEEGGEIWNAHLDQSR